MEVTGRGRPKKDPSERSEVKVSVHVTPSEKEIIRGEADRCSTTMTDIVETYAFEELEPQGRTVPDPEVLYWLKEKLDQVEAKAKEREDVKMLEADLGMISGEFGTKAVEMKAKKKEREKLWEDRKEEEAGKVVVIRVTRDKKRWIDKRADQEGKTKSMMLRVACLTRIRKEEQIGQLAEWIEGWGEELETIASGETGDVHPRQAAVELAEQIKRKVLEEVYS
jgi:uncharacterized protein (DUF1778 family)